MSSIKVYCNNLENHPHCVHGPTLLFSRQVNGKERKFYACSACRDRKECSFFMWEDEKISQSKLLKWRKRESEAISGINHREIYSKLCEFKRLPIKYRIFCQTCFNFVFPKDELHKNHQQTKNVTDKLLKFPSLLIKPIESNKKEAQFWFAESSKQFIIDALKLSGVRTCLSIGVPTVHELLRETEIKSVLLDFDKRYHYFYNENEFCWFNMFNCHYMSNKEVYEKVVEDCLNSSVIGVIIDPPFGARIEPLAYTINQFKKQCATKLNIFLILPYFMETNVIKYFPDLNMLDYQIQYTNHNKFKNRAEKKPSPVRIFTNVSPALLEMPASEGYYYCKNCKCWRSKNNKHCDLCKTCPSKNGELYIHCDKCSKCVKQTWIHCVNCGHCVIPGHQCFAIQKDLKKFNKKRKVKQECSDIGNKLADKTIFKKKKRKRQ